MYLIVEKTQEDYKLLVEAVKNLLSKRAVTDRTYEEAYDFTFKSWGWDEWDKLADLTEWTESDIPEELKE